MSLVALSASYGAGGSRIGPALAQRLDVPFLDRAIPAAVAAELAVPLEDAQARDECVSASSWLERLLSGYIAHDITWPAAAPGEHATSAAGDFRRATENVLLATAAGGRGVILGRGAVVVLREDDRVLRVRLDGPPELRARRAAVMEGIGEAEARSRMRRLDRAHATYLRQCYGCDIGDTSLYHVMLDSTRIPLEECVEMLAGAARALSGARGAV